MTTLKKACEEGKLDQFIKERAPETQVECLEKYAPKKLDVGT